MPEIKNEEIMSHNAVLNDRKHLVLSGVLDVEKFDENIVVLYTELGKLCVKGRDLNLMKLDINDLSGEVVVDGEIDSLEYDKGKLHKKNESFISKLLG
ncbi:MAG: YabP/YqfC family sporulation protein [Clostridia bacterium]|nr:YabP/YqfC family sporulation protein [Clostridia bacterium]